MAPVPLSVRAGSLVDDLSARCSFPPHGTVVTCAVSGGADSLALLVLAIHAGLDATAVHVDHGLRSGAEAEAGLVAQVAADLGARFRSERVVVAEGPDLEARARRARHGALPVGSLFGHTADDQAETVLLALMRGTGLDGLAAMSPETHPILGLRRAETRALCDALGLEAVEDPSNDDRRFRRNRVRHEVLPLLHDVAERDVVPLLCRLAVLARGEADALDRLAAHLDPSDARALADAPEALARRAVRTWVRGRSPERHPPDAAAVERVLAVARGEAVAAQIAGGSTVRRRGGRLRLEATGGHDIGGEGGATGGDG